MNKSYRVEFETPAWKALMALAPRLQERLFTAIEELELNPRRNGVKKLQNEDDLYRVRVGDYRIIYSIEDERLLVLIIDVGHRREIYR